MKKYKKLWIMSIVILIIICVVIFIFINNDNKNNNDNDNELVLGNKNYEMYISINPIIKINFKEKYEMCENQELDNKCELSTIITEYELVNDDAKKMLKDIEIKEKDILEAISMIVDNVHDNNINFSTINITTDWKNCYEEDAIINKLNEGSKIKRDYKVIIKEVEKIKPEEIMNYQIVSKKIEKNNIAMMALNVDVLSEKELHPTLVHNHDKYTIEVFGKKEIIDNLDLKNVDLYVDCTELSNLDLETDITGPHEVNVYLKTNEDIYYSISPNKAEVGISYYPYRDINITNDEIKNILNKYELSLVHLTLNGDTAVQCKKIEGKPKCQISSNYQIDDKPTKELFLIYDRFNITYDNNGIPLNLKANWCSPVIPLFNCLDQTWFEI